jgi:hypothetical protein
LLSKTISQRYRFSKQLSVNAAFKAAKLLPTVAPPKLLFKIFTESRVPKTLPKTPMLLPEAASKLVWKAVQSCSPKLFLQAAP